MRCTLSCIVSWLVGLLVSWLVRQYLDSFLIVTQFAIYSLVGQIVICFFV